MDFNRLTIRFWQFGGWRLIIEYAKLGVLLIGIKAFFMCVLKRQSFKAIYPEILHKIEPFLEQRYVSITSSFKQSWRVVILMWLRWLQQFSVSQVTTGRGRMNILSHIWKLCLMHLIVRYGIAVIRVRKAVVRRAAY